MRQVTGLPVSAGMELSVIHSGQTYTDPATGTSKAAIYNNPAGAQTAYPVNAKVLNVGNSPDQISFSVQGLQLHKQVLDGASPAIASDVVVADNIVMIKGVYALDNNGDGTVDTWSNSIASNADAKKIIGMRLAVLARSPLKERAGSNGVCNVTANPIITWMGGTMDVSGLQDWGCYRYRMLQTTVAFKNVLWGG